MHARIPEPRPVLVPLLFLSMLSGFASSGAAAGFDAHRIWTTHGDEPGAGFGSAVATGDVNGDGFRDVIVGAPHATTAAGRPNGKAFVYYGSSQGLPSSPGWTAEGEGGRTYSSLFGSSVAAADVNRDGFDDVIIGAWNYQPIDGCGGVGEGRVYVYYGSAMGLPSDPSFVADGFTGCLGEQTGLGNTLATGDFNGDGYADVAASRYQAYTGGATVFYGSAAGLSEDRSWKLMGGNPFHQYSGASVSAGDFNADGFDDLIVTVQSTSPSTSVDEPPWAAILYLGSSEGLSSPEAFPAFSLTEWANATSVGDLDGDGIDDIFVLELKSEFEYGSIFNFPAYVPYRGTPLGPPRRGKAAGAAVAFPENGTYGTLYQIGDLNGDGFADVIAVDNVSFSLYFGSPSGLNPLSDGMGPFPAGPFAHAGDVNGDGIDDLIAGIPTNEQVDLYRGGTDWSFEVTADVAIQTLPGVGSFDLTLTNAGPDAVRLRVFDPVPAGLVGARWQCNYFDHVAGVVSTRAAAPECEVPPGRTGDLDSPATIAAGEQLTFTFTGNVVAEPVVNIASLVLPEWATDPDLSNNQTITVTGPPLQLLLIDNFESGTLSAWSSHSASGVAAAPAAALQGDYGLQVSAPPSGSALVRDDSPADEADYHARFLLDPTGFGLVNSVHIATGRDYRATLFSGHAQGAAPRLFEIGLERNRGALSLRTRAFLDDGTWLESAPLPITDARHIVEMAWRRSSAPAASDGQMQLWLDGAEAASLSGLRTPAEGVDYVELGLVPQRRLPASIKRTVLLDAFESWRPQ
jgi:hypothetical protein